MNKLLFFLVLLIVCVGALFIFTSQSQKKEKSEEQESSKKAEDVKEHRYPETHTGLIQFHSLPLQEATNRFALELYHRMGATSENLEPQNVIFSPYSAHTALSMTGAGARGETLEEMSKVLGLSLSNSTTHQKIGEEMTRLMENAKTDGVMLNISNALFVEETYSLHSAFEDLVKENYRAGLESVDFEKKPMEQVDLINQWVARATEDKIQKLLAPDDIQSTTKLVLVNAIYLKAAWEKPFHVLRTLRPESFWKKENESVNATFIYRQDDFQYLETEKMQILEVPYVGNHLSMVILLPKKREGLHELESQLTNDNLIQWTNELQKNQVQVYLPKFKSRMRLELSDALKKIGMASAFDPAKADFSSMHAYCGEGEEANMQHPFISQVIHEAMIEVDEKGTEAAAATAVVMSVTGKREENPKEVKVFRADHPFLYVVRDRKSGVILFMGRLEDPSKT